MRAASRLGVLVFAILGLDAAAAWALEQPDGTTIPEGNGLAGLFASRGEAIDATGDALTVPQTFVPSCALTFEVLQRNAGMQNSFGWYNVTGEKPADADLHEFLACDDPVGTVKVLSIKNDPAYLGGEIGFYEATGDCGTALDHEHVFYSEAQFNPDGDASDPYVHLLIYNSTTTPKAFYFGWEDLLSGGDNDFDDLTTFVTGITCSGGGDACETGDPGICALGTLQCQNGEIVCVPQVGPRDEVCDGVDNDCDGAVDDGDLCPVGEVCDQGNCVPACGGTEFVCTPGTACNASGYCVDEDCLDVTCGEGTKCTDGVCVAPCDGVTCPHGQVCVVGTCVDPCEGIVCDASQVCVAGGCVDRCDCGGCPEGQACQDDGRCIPSTCAGVVCEPGTYCDAGSCVDACEGVVCPGGGVCALGVCGLAPEGAGGAGAGGGDGGSGLSFDVGAGGEPSFPSDPDPQPTNPGEGTGGSAYVPPEPEVDASKSCACGLGQRSDDASALAAAAAALALVAGRAASRRRRRS